MSVDSLCNMVLKLMAIAVDLTVDIISLKNKMLGCLYLLQWQVCHAKKKKKKKKKEEKKRQGTPDYCFTH